MKKLFLLVLIALTTLMASCGSKPEVFVMGTSNFNGDFYNGWTNSAYDNNIRRLVWGYGLMAPTNEGNLVISPLVKSRTTLKSDPAKDIDDVWVFKMKEGLKFSNGDPLTVKDVKFTYDFYMDKKALQDTGGTSSLDQYIEKVEIDEEANTATFTLKEMVFTIDESAFHTPYIMNSKIISEGAAKDGITPQQWVKANISSPIGYGPYKIEEYVESQFVKLVINENFQGDAHGDKPSIPTLIVQNVPSETEVTQLLTGEVDALTGIIKDTKIDAVKEDESIATNDYYRHGGGQITFHCDYGPVQLPEVRKAFAYEFNRVKFRNLFLGNYGISSNAPYSRNMWMMYDKGESFGTEGAFEKTLKNYDILNNDGSWNKEANLAKAHELLDLAASKTEGEYAKLTKDANGRYLWEGKELTLNLAITSSWTDAINLTLTKEVQEEFGIKVNVEVIDWSVMASHLYGNISATERKYHMFTGGTSYALKYNPYANWSSTKILPFGQGASTNSNRYSSNEELLDKIRFSNATTDEGVAKYKKYWREWIVSINEDLPQLPLYSNNYYDAYNNKLEDFETNALWQWPYAIVKAKIKK